MTFLSNTTNKAEEKTAFTSFAPTALQGAATSKQTERNGFLSLQTGVPDKAAFARFRVEGDQLAKSISTPEEEIARVEQEAYEKGFAQGEKDGLELGETKARKLLHNVETLLKEISELKNDLIRRHEKEILEMIFAIARKVVQAQLNFDEKAVRGPVLDALRLTADKSDITLQINPEDLDYVEHLRPELFAEIKGLKSVMIVSDSTVKRGGCKLETKSGDIDATVETRLELIYKSLQEAYTG